MFKNGNYTYCANFDWMTSIINSSVNDRSHWQQRYEKPVNNRSHWQNVMKNRSTVKEYLKCLNLNNLRGLL